MRGYREYLQENIKLDNDFTQRCLVKLFLKNKNSESAEGIYLFI